MIVLNRAKRTSFLKLNFSPKSDLAGSCTTSKRKFDLLFRRMFHEILLGHWIVPTSAIIVSSKA